MRTDIETEVDPLAEARVTKMLSGHALTLDGGGQRITLRLSDEVADQVHAQLAAVLGKQCAPRDTATILGVEYSLVGDPRWAARLAREARTPEPV